MDQPPLPASPPTPAATASHSDITGNTGTTNDLEFNASSISIDRGGSTLTPFSFTQNATANGESVYTTMQAYDSLGNTVNVNLTATLTSSSPSGTTWQFLATSPNTTSTAAATNTVIGQGTLNFNNFGQLDQQHRHHAQRRPQRHRSGAFALFQPG